MPRLSSIAPLSADARNTGRKQTENRLSLTPTLPGIGSTAQER